MSLDRFQFVAIIILILCLILHLFPTIILSYYRRNKGGRPIWTTYLIWFIILPVLFGPLIAGRIPFLFFCLIISIAGILEFIRHTGLRDDLSSKAVIIIALCLLYIAVFLGNWVLFTGIHFISFSIIILFYLFKLKPEQPEKWLEKPLLSIFLYTYCGAFFSFLPLFYSRNYGREFLFLYILLLINNDAFGYIFGSLFGKHRLIPNISPNKTVEGVLAGIGATLILGVLFRPYLIPEYSMGKFFILCLLLSLGGTAGDLVMSMCKRSLKLKDFGNLIPGHGGILDRLDSLLFIAPIFYFYLVFTY